MEGFKRWYEDTGAAGSPSQKAGQKQHFPAPVAKFNGHLQTWLAIRHNVSHREFDPVRWAPHEDYAGSSCSSTLFGILTEIYLRF
jgi:hypothetical protein